MCCTLVEPFYPHQCAEGQQLHNMLCKPTHTHPAPALQSARVLARAIKEWVRREGDKQGFSNAPADCLAFKYYRDVSALGQDYCGLSRVWAEGM